MNLIKKIILPLCFIASICCLGCEEAEPLYFGLSLKAEITMLNVEEATVSHRLTKKEGVKVDLQDSTNLWNPFNHPEHAYEASISYRLLREEDLLLSRKLGIAVKGKMAYSGERKIEYLFGNGDQPITLPRWKARQKFEFDDLLGEISSSMELSTRLNNCQGCHSISLNNRIDTREDNYRHSGQSTADRLVFEFSNPIATEDFGYRFHGFFEKGDRYSLTSSSQASLEQFGGMFLSEQSAAMEKKPTPLKITCYVGKGFKWKDDRFDNLGFEMYKHIYGFDSHTEALEAHGPSLLRPVLGKPNIVVDKSIKDRNEFFWVLEYGNPVAE